MIQHGKKFYFHQTITAHRKEKIQFKNVEDKIKEQKQRNPNVFKHWIQDTPQLVEKCMLNDLEHWRVDKFIKDSHELRATLEVIKENYIFLRECYVITASLSSFPFVNKYGLWRFIKECGNVKD